MIIDVSPDSNNGVFRRYHVGGNPVNSTDPTGLVKWHIHINYASAGEIYGWAQFRFRLFTQDKKHYKYEASYTSDWRDTGGLTAGLPGATAGQFDFDDGKKMKECETPVLPFSDKGEWNIVSLSVAMIYGFSLGALDIDGHTFNISGIQFGLDASADLIGGIYNLDYYKRTDYGGRTKYLKW